MVKGNGFIVTNKEIYEEVKKVNTKIDGIDLKLSVHLEHSKVASQARANIEKKQWTAIYALYGLMAILTISIITKMLIGG